MEDMNTVTIEKPVRVPNVCGPVCSCGRHLSACAGCQDPRCLTCEPYLSDDCRWGI